MLYTKIQPQSFLGSGDIYGHGGHFVQWCGTIQTNYQYPFDRRSHVKSDKKQFQRRHLNIHNFIRVYSPGGQNVDCN